ncbi:MAG: hypothetical protein HXY34_11140 [Candidatus Thorarchaeota archaeon]|nr:hypothetical protein [Candidatus Thorarchaeota archaeon]
MPIVEIAARRLLERNPSVGISIVDTIVLLWMYTNPYDSRRRQLSSMRNVLKMTETIRTASGGLEVTDDELTQIVLGSLQRLSQRGMVHLRSAGRIFVVGTLTDTSVRLIETTLDGTSLKTVMNEFGDNP